MDDTWYRRGNKPRKAHHTVDQIERTTQAQIPVVGITMLKVPCNAIIEEDQNKRQSSRSGSCERYPSFAINIAIIYNPRACSDGFSLIFTVIRPERIASLGAACVGWLKGVRHTQALEFDLVEDNNSKEGA
eukprot:scaffold152727_cov102-Attheya_sp.AAC.1